MAHAKMTLVDWLDDLCVRFIVNLPNEELQSVERICFQIEEAQWFYEDFIRPLDPNNLPSMHLRKFSQLMFQHCPLFSAYSEELHQQAYEQFLAYKTRVPVRGAIMLNEDMTHAVLVKGWKKGAKWSFPRGKINKEESDLDCAVREVYEETGYDLRETDLVLPDEHMKKITVTMREQSMMLYVFRGVPMDTYFEPRTRKEISKIDWYKLTDLPAMRRKNQVQQQVPGQETIKESSFYMVAPFLQPLKAWIKQQHKLDRQKARSSAYLVAPPAAITDDEDLHVDPYDTIADESVPAATTQPANNFANLVAQLGSNVRPSDAPELSQQSFAQQQVPDPAAELKRLLSVGMGVQSPPVEAPSGFMPTPQPQTNSLLALFKQGNNPVPPRTPYDQIMSPPVQPSSPHGQHQPRPPQTHDMPPPPFPYSPHAQRVHFQGPPQHFNGMSPPQMAPPFMHHPQHETLAFSPPQPSMQQAFDAQNPRPFHAEVGSQFAGEQGRPVIPSASNLPTPKLTAHTLGLLNSFKIDDQNIRPPQSFPDPGLQQRGSQQPSGAQNIPSPYHMHNIVSPPAPYTMSPPQYKSPPVSASFEPEQPKPRTIHQDSLLTLFRGTPPIASPEPAELSALPHTPAYVSAQPVAGVSQQPDLKLLGSFGSMPEKTSPTSATVSGPVNAPDFDTMKKHSHPVSGSSRGPSPAAHMPFKPQQILQRKNASPVPQATSASAFASVQQSQQKSADDVPVEQKVFKPQILKRPQQQQPEVSVPPARSAAHAQGLLDMFKTSSPQSSGSQPAHSVHSGPSPVPSAHARGLLDMFNKGPSPQPAPLQTTQPIQPSRSPAPPANKQGLLDLFKSASPQPSLPQAPPSIASARSPAPSDALDRRDSVPSEQKSTLLALFNKPSPNTQPAAPALPRHSHTPLPPPTPKTAMSGVISPVSPLPTTTTASPANGNGNNNDARSRISSIGDGTTVGLVIPPPTSQPVGEAQQMYSAGGLNATQRADGKSPVDKNFLLGFLEDVARRGR